MAVTDDNYSYETTLTKTNAFAPGFAIEIERTLIGIADELTSVNVLVMTQWRTPNANVNISYYNVPWIGGLAKQKAVVTPNIAFDIGDVAFADVSGFLYSEIIVSVIVGTLTLFNGTANAAFRDRTPEETAHGYGVNVISRTCTGYPAYAVWQNRGGVFFVCPLKLRNQANTLNDDGYFQNGNNQLPAVQSRSSIVKTYETPPIHDRWQNALQELGSTPYVKIYDDPDGAPESVKVSSYTIHNTQATFTATFFNKIY